MTYTVRRALATDTDVVIELLAARARWLRTEGHDQWSKKNPTRTTTASIAAGETWLLTDDATSNDVGTITWSSTADLDFWLPKELAMPALYLSKMATSPELRGRGLGALLIYSAWRYAQRRGVSTLRWDAWRTNDGLQNYYKRLGARYVRSVEVSDRNSGALFEWAYQEMFAEPDEAQMLRLDAPIGVIAVVNSIVRRLQPTFLGDDTNADAFAADPSPDHWHEVPDLLAPNLGEDLPTQPQPLTVVANTPGPLLFHSGDVWRARHLYSHPVKGKALNRLVRGRLYRLKHITQGNNCRIAVIGDARTQHPAG